MSKFPWYQAVEQNKFARFVPSKLTRTELKQTLIFSIIFVIPFAWLCVEQLAK